MGGTKYRVMLGAALTAGVTPVEAREIVYQAVPYPSGATWRPTLTSGTTGRR